MSPMARDTKFGYGYTLIGIGVAYLLDKIFGPLVALYIAGGLTLVGIIFLVAGHRHKEKEENGKVSERREWKSIAKAVAIVGFVMCLATGGIYGWKILYPPSLPFGDCRPKGRLLSDYVAAGSGVSGGSGIVTSYFPTTGDDQTLLFAGIPLRLLVEPPGKIIDTSKLPTDVRLGRCGVGECVIRIKAVGGKVVVETTKAVVDDGKGNDCVVGVKISALN